MNFFNKVKGLVRGPTDAGPFPLSLALQGGGSFGAFAWGVLDRLLEEDAIAFDCVSGASAGAVNATLMASGMIEGGRDGARAKLEHFWRRISDAASFLPAPLAPVGMGALMKAMAPFQFNPFDLNPLRRALEAEVDFEQLRAASPVRLMVAATRVSDGSLRIFRNAEMSVDVVLASACLPLLHHTIEIEGEGYWDGGYAANPPLIQLVHEMEARDVLVVQITPSRTSRTPVSKTDIVKRLEQITFNATLNAEIEALKLASSLRATPKMRELRIDRIAAEDEVQDLAERSAANLDWRFLTDLRDAGRKAADVWIAERTTHAGHTGRGWAGIPPRRSRPC